MKIVITLVFLTIATGSGNPPRESFLAEVWGINYSQVKPTLVTLIEDVLIPLFLNGKQIGNMALKTGRVLELLKEDNDLVEVKLGSSVSELSKKSTNLHATATLTSQ